MSNVVIRLQQYTILTMINYFEEEYVIRVATERNNNT